MMKLEIAKKQGKEGKQKLGETRKAGTRPSHALAEYVGDYEHAGYGVLHVVADNSSSGDPGLAFSYNGITTPLEHWHYDVFSGKKNEKDRTFEQFKIEFTTGFDGEVESLRAVMEATEEAFVFKRLGDAKLSDPAYLARFAGDYELGGQTCKVAVSGKTLTVTVPGQPTYELEPARNDTFHLKGLTGFSLKFKADESGAVNEAEFVQPNGVFTAKRVFDKK